MIKIAICDDEQAICGQLESMLGRIEELFPQKLEVTVFLSGEELYGFLSQGSYFDIIFLDIELKIMNGVEIGQRIRNEFSNETTQIVYISGKETYAMELFKTRPLDFVIKPLRFEKIARVLKTALKLMQKKDDMFQYQIGHANYQIPIRNIIYFESINPKVHIVTAAGMKSFYEKLDNIFDQVRRFNFIRIHKSYLVNYNHIIKLEYHQVTMSNEKTLPISQKNRKGVRELQLQLGGNDVNE